MPDSEYADDTALPFCSHADVDEQTPLVCAHFRRWGMEVHEGTLNEAGEMIKDSKSEILFCPTPLHMYEDATHLVRWY